MTLLEAAKTGAKWMAWMAEQKMIEGPMRNKYLDDFAEITKIVARSEHLMRVFEEKKAEIAVNLGPRNSVYISKEEADGA